jgi:hypothetical protein
MRSQLQKRLEGEGWRVSDAPTHDQDLLETDIELHHIQYGTFHVEVKHSEADAIYWSENEVEKAKRNSGRYFMVILNRDKEADFEEYWLNDPLKDLKDVSRTGVWEWHGRQAGVKLFGDVASWDAPAPRPERAAARFSFKAELERSWLRQRGLKFEKIREYFRS